MISWINNAGDQSMTCCSRACRSAARTQLRWHKVADTDQEFKVTESSDLEPHEITKSKDQARWHLIFSRNSTQAAGPTVKLHGQGGVRTATSLPMILPSSHFREWCPETVWPETHSQARSLNAQVSAVPSSHLRRQLYLSSPWPPAWQRICFSLLSPGWYDEWPEGQPTGTWHVAPGPCDVKLSLETGESSPATQAGGGELSHTTGLSLELSRVMEMFYFPFRVSSYISICQTHQTRCLRSRILLNIK